MVGLLCIAASTDMMAQEAITFLSEVNTQVRSAGSLIYQVVIAVLSVIAIASLVTVGIRLYSGDQESIGRRLLYHQHHLGSPLT